MPADNLSPHEMLNYVPLTAAVNQVVTDLPKVLPPAFYSQTREVLGNKFRRFLVRGTRQTSRRANYGAPPRTTNRITRARQDVVMLHTIENITAGDEVLQIFHGMQDYNVSLMAQEVLDQDALEFGRRIDNHRTAAIHSMAANGFIWYDANDEILPTASGAVTTVDYQIPNANRVASAASWSNTASDIVTEINTFKSMAQRNGGGRMPKIAIYGANVAGYLARNTFFQAYLARNPNFNDYFKSTGFVMNGTLDLTWVQAQDAYYERSDESFPMQFPADQITFFPELTRDVYELKVGSYPVPKQFYGFANGGDFSSMVREMFDNPVYGAFKYSYGQALPVPQIWMVQGDTFFPDLPNPQSIWYYDTTP